MEALSSEGELLQIHNAFHQGQYSQTIKSDPNAFSDENKLPARVLALRALVAVGQSDDVVADLEGEEDVPDLAAVKVYAQYAAGKHSSAMIAMERLIEASPENAAVQVLGGTLLQAEGRSDEALALLAKHQNNLEASALIVQIQLQQNRTDLALKEAHSARRWAQDSLLVNLAEAWVGLRIGGEKYQQAFYVFEELAQAPSTSSIKTLLGQAVAELHLGRLQEAEAALQQAMEKDSTDAEVIANTIVLFTISGKDPKELMSSLRSAAPTHPSLVDWQEKSELFDRAAAKYSARVA